MEVKKKILLLCAGNPADKTLWSGTVNNMYQQFLRCGFAVEAISPTSFTKKELAFFEKTARLYEDVFNRTFNRHQFMLKAWLASGRFKNRLKCYDFDILVSVSEINELAFLNIPQPIIYINDILYEQHIGYYPYYQGLGWYSKTTLRFLEKTALSRCAAVILPSEWSVNRALSFYNLKPDRVHLLRFGPNMEVPEKVETKIPGEEVNLLFLGVDWVRKGGDIALKTVEILNKKGYQVKLTVVGCVPPEKSPIMQVIPFLNKNKPEEVSFLKEILSNSDFLFVPTRAECYGIVFCEASAYGLPSITTNTGGVTSIIQEGVNGYALPLSATAEEYALLLEKLFNNNEKRIQLKRTSRNRYEEALTWDSWSATIDKLIKSILNNGSRISK